MLHLESVQRIYFPAREGLGNRFMRPKLPSINDRQETRGIHGRDRLNKSPSLSLTRAGKTGTRAEQGFTGTQGGGEGVRTPPPSGLKERYDWGQTVPRPPRRELSSNTFGWTRTLGLGEDKNPLATSRRGGYKSYKQHNKRGICLKAIPEISTTPASQEKMLKNLSLPKYLFNAAEDFRKIKTVCTPKTGSS